MDEFVFWAGLANMEKGWCAMDCRRKCEHREACEQIKRACGYDTATVRRLAAKTLDEIAAYEASERAMKGAV